MEGQMSASTQTAPAQLGFGRVPSAIATLALVVVLAVAVAIVALNGTKAAPTTGGTKAAPPPAVIDHGWSNGETVILPKTIQHPGGFGGPRLAPAIPPTLKGPVYLGEKPYTGGAPSGVRSRAQ
jgi:hypothetical protein